MIDEVSLHCNQIKVKVSMNRKQMKVTDPTHKGPIRVEAKIHKELTIIEM